jgi:hypothetical protein
MSDNSIIDEKKGQYLSSDSTESYGSKLVSFIISFVVVILIIFIYFSSSSLVLFMCKIAQSNILPSEPNCAPYTDAQPTINPSPLKTNIFTTFTDPEMSMKIEIPYDINSKNKLIEMFKKYKEKSSSNFLANYFISIIEAILQFNYASINAVMNLMNSTLPEPAIVGIGPIICGFLYAFGILSNTLYFIYLWFTNMVWFFKTNTNDTGNGKPQWEDVTLLSPVNWFFGAALSMLFVFILIFGFPIVSILPMVFFHNSLISTLFMKAIMNGKQITSFAIIKETLKHYKLSIVILTSIFIVLLAFSRLGAIPGILSIITIALIYYGIISINIFESIPETNLSPSVSYEQATKKCPSSNKHFEKHGLLYNLIFGQKGGGNITKQLKYIGKKLH